MSPDELLGLIHSGVGSVTDGEPVDEYEHALQCAGLALAAGADAELVVSAVLHDIGYHPRVIARFPDQPHESAGANFAAELFGERVAWLIAQHVPAKRYLVATDGAYAARLSEASVRSLGRQGGPMSLTEVEAFGAHPWASAAARLRRWDDLAKVPGATTISLAELRPIFEQLLEPARR